MVKYFFLSPTLTCCLACYLLLAHVGIVLVSYHSLDVREFNKDLNIKPIYSVSEYEYMKITFVNCGLT